MIKFPNAYGYEDLDKYHDCEREGCTEEQHYGSSKYGLCLVCSGCGDPECCQHDSNCFPPD